jgi:hypothetical protein
VAFEHVQATSGLHAALGCALLQLSAVVFHISRGEAANTPFNFLLVALSLFVVWGRRRRPTTVVASGTRAGLR